MGEIINILSRQFTLQSANAHSAQVWFCVAAIWIIVVICTLTSIYSRPFSRAMKAWWSAIVVLAPLLGVLAYLPFSVSGELFPYLGFWRPTKR